MRREARRSFIRNHGIYIEKQPAIAAPSPDDAPRIDQFRFAPPRRASAYRCALKLGGWPRHLKKAARQCDQARRKSVPSVQTSIMLHYKRGARIFASKSSGMILMTSRCSCNKTGHQRKRHTIALRGNRASANNILSASSGRPASNLFRKVFIIEDACMKWSP